jgi:TetR/AcrR family transcriptional regulator
LGGVLCVATNQTGKEKILEASLDEFAEKGYDGSRVDKIAEKAGVNKALIYYHFQSKEGLYEAVIDFLFQKAIPAKMDLPNASVRENFLHMMRQFLVFLHVNPYFVKIMDQTVNKEGGFFEKIHQQNVFFQLGMNLYQEGVANGEFKPVKDPVDFLFSLVGACYFFFSRKNSIKRFYFGKTDEEILEIRIQTMTEIVERVLFKEE